MADDIPRDRAEGLTESLDTIEHALQRAHGGELRALKEAQRAVLKLRQQANDLSRRQNELAALYMIVRQLTTVLDLDRLLGLILDQAMLLMRADRGFLVLAHMMDDGYDVVLVRGMDASELERTDRPAISRKLVWHVLQTRQPLVTTDAQHDDRFSDSSSIIAFQIRSVLAVPLLYQQDLIGALYLDTRMNVRAFDAEDLNLVSALATQAAVAIHMARLYGDLEAKNTRLAGMLKELRDAQDELLLRERLSAIGSVASRVVHDLKGPMTVIKGMAQILGDADLTHDQRTQVAGIIDQQIDAFVGMTQEILDFSKGEQSLQLSSFDGGQLLQDMRDFLAEEFAGSGVKLELQVEQSGAIIGDRQRLWRAVYNIAKNAVEAMSADGKSGGLLVMTIRRSSPYVELVLSDTGGGLPPQLQDRLFQPFATFGKVHGTGLGLAIARSIVEAHRGEILVDTVTGRGCTFTIRLPQ